ncbi:MAG: hypothetical protein JW846_05730 [Dehalococcoidia bacterium]|nr:hypothetical protein [Dehalococcoidia bacterium]
MTDEQPFELRVFALSSTEYGLELRQRRLNGDQRPGELSVRVVRLWGTPLSAVMDHVLEGIRKNGYRASDLRASRQSPFMLDEEQGVRLGLLFLAVKPLRKLERIEAVSRRVKQMETEEVYYWYSKCRSPNERRRACRAVRILMAEE